TRAWDVRTRGKRERAPVELVLVHPTGRTTHAQLKTNSVVNDPAEIEPGPCGAFVIADDVDRGVPGFDLPQVHFAVLRIDDLDGGAGGVRRLKKGRIDDLREPDVPAAHDSVPSCGHANGHRG